MNTGPIFVVSTNGSGTTTLAESLGRHPHMTGVRSCNAESTGDHTLFNALRCYWREDMRIQVFCKQSIGYLTPFLVSWQCFEVINLGDYMKQFLKRMYQYYRPVMNWRLFSWKVRSKGCTLLCNADMFISPIYVSGCQRSGTTLVSRLIRQSPEIRDIQFSRDDELDAAYILSGRKNINTNGRFCFQTTYLNECYHEYLRLDNDFKLIWVIRNPYSVIYSMAYNWSRFPLNELFKSCGYSEAIINGYKGSPTILALRLSPTEKACFAYLGKLNQLFDLLEKLDKKKIFVVDYDSLVKNKKEMLLNIFNYINVEFDEKYIGMIREDSVSKSEKLSSSEKDMIDNYCGNIFLRAKDVAEKYV